MCQISVSFKMDEADLNDKFIETGKFLANRLEFEEVEWLVQFPLD